MFYLAPLSLVVLKHRRTGKVSGLSILAILTWSAGRSPRLPSPPPHWSGPRGASLVLHSFWSLILAFSLLLLGIFLCSHYEKIKCIFFHFSNFGFISENTLQIV